MTGKPDARWAELAEVALDQGLEAEEIAQAAFRGHHTIRTIRGHGRDYWGEWHEAFEALESDPRPGIQVVARCGKEIALALVRDSQARERREQLFGR